MHIEHRILLFDILSALSSRTAEEDVKSDQPTTELIEKTPLKKGDRADRRKAFYGLNAVHCVSRNKAGSIKWSIALVLVHAYLTLGIVQNAGQAKAGQKKPVKHHAV